MKRQYLAMTERLKYWNDKVDTARKNDDFELSLLLEAPREYVRNLRSICVRMNKVSPDATENNYPDSIVSSDDDSVFGMEMHLSVEGEGGSGKSDVNDVLFATLLMTRITPETKLPIANIAAADLIINGNVIHHGDEPIKDPVSLDTQIRESLVSVLRGYDRLAFAYTPYVMMINRLSSTELDKVNVTPDAGQLIWAMSAISQNYLIETHFNFGVLRDYFNM